jgi:uncharacterized surface protein with fasciclin (FAS1) repeats
MKMLKTITVLVVSLVIFAFTAKINLGEKTISELVAEKSELSTLNKALEAADLTETLKGEGPYTIFAPTDEGFNNLPEGRLDELMKPENKAELAQVLKYHVVAGEVKLADIQGEQFFETLDGNRIRVTAGGEMPQDEGMQEEMQEDVQDETGYEEEAGSQSSEIKVNNANVVESDIVASNGLIQIIDGVAMPTDIDVMGASEPEMK